MSLANRVIDAYFGCDSALRALTQELNDTPSSRLHSLLHLTISGSPYTQSLTMKHLLFLFHTAVLRCKSSVVVALANILADMGITVCDVPLLLLLIRRNNMDLIQAVLDTHFVERTISQANELDMGLEGLDLVDALTLDTTDPNIAALVVREFKLSHSLADALRSAVKLNDVSRCVHLVRIGAPLETRAYITAAARGYAAICDLFVDAGFEDVRAQENKALRLAASRGHLAVCRHIVYVALPRTVMCLGRPRSLLDDIRMCHNEAFRWACGNGHVDVCRLLLACGLTLHDIRDDDNNALRWACGNGHLEVCRLLLNQSPGCGWSLTPDDLRARDNEALRMAAKHGHLDVVRLLLACGLTVEDVRAQDNFVLRWAAKSGDYGLCQLLLGALPAVPYWGRAGAFGSLGSGAELPSCGGQSPALSPHSARPLPFRKETKSPNLDSGASLTLDDIRACDNEALRAAASFGHLGICKLLWRRGLTLHDLRARNNEAFRSAAFYGHLNVCKFLMRCGLTRADAWAGEGEAMAWAVKREQHDVCVFLLSLNLLDDMTQSEPEFIPV